MAFGAPSYRIFTGQRASGRDYTVLFLRAEGGLEAGTADYRAVALPLMDAGLPITRRPAGIESAHAGCVTVQARAWAGWKESVWGCSGYPAIDEKQEVMVVFFPLSR